MPGLAGDAPMSAALLLFFIGVALILLPVYAVSALAYQIAKRRRTTA